MTGGSEQDPAWHNFPVPETLQTDGFATLIFNKCSLLCITFPIAV
jgi:hypothetical protein